MPTACEMPGFPAQSQFRRSVITNKLPLSLPSCLWLDFAGKSARATLSRTTPSEEQFQSDLDLPGGVGGVGLHEVLWLLVIARVGSDADFCRALYEGRGIRDQAVRGNDQTLVVAVQKVEGLGDQVEFAALGEAEFASEAEVGGGIVGSGEGVTAVAGESVVEAVAVLVGIAGNGGIDRTSAADVQH